MVEHEEIDIGGMDKEEIATKVVTEMLVCEVCETQNPEAEELDHETTDDGIHISMTFECSACGAHNRPEVWLS